MTSTTPYQIRLNLSGSGPAPPIRNAEADRVTLRLIQTKARAGEMGLAISLSEAALASGLEHPMVLNLVAVGLENQDRVEEAQDLLRRALDLAPGDLGVLNALGIGALRLERFTDALGYFEACLASHPNFAAGHANHGAALLGLSRLLEAELSLRRSLELQPGHLAALSGLAAIASRRGDHAKARTLGETVLDTEPNHPDSTISVATAELALGAPDAAEQRLHRLLADSRPTQVDRATAMGLLADVLDARGQTVEAFGAYSQSNDMLRVHYAARYGVGEGAIDATLRMAGYFETALPFPGPAPARRGDGPALVFLMGFPRSGTTLLETILGGHEQVETLEERETLIDSTRNFLVDNAGLDRLLAADEGQLAPFRGAYWARAREAGARLDRRVFIDKAPLNTLKLPLIARLFPDARILFSRRDPRDVVLSCFRRRFQINPQMYPLLTLDGAAGFYDAAMRLNALLEPTLPNPRRIVRHEQLVTDFEGEVGQTLDFLGLAWRPQMTDVAGRARTGAIATPSGAQISRGLNAEGIGQWRRYRDQMAPVLPILAPWVERFGYAPA